MSDCRHQTVEDLYRADLPSGNVVHELAGVARRTSIETVQDAIRGQEDEPVLAFGAGRSAFDAIEEGDRSIFGMLRFGFDRIEWIAAAVVFYAMALALQGSLWSVAPMALCLMSVFVLVRSVKLWAREGSPALHRRAVALATPIVVVGKRNIYYAAGDRLERLPIGTIRMARHTDSELAFVHPDGEARWPIVLDRGRFDDIRRALGIGFARRGGGCPVCNAHREWRDWRPGWI